MTTLATKCTKCDCSVPNNFKLSYGNGSKDSKIVFISPIAPTKREEKIGVFCTPKYDILNLTFARNGYDTDNSYFTHIIKCKMTRFPTSFEIISCIEHVLTELTLLRNLKLIVAIGSTSFKVFTGLSLTKHINKPILLGKKYIIIGINHPDFMVRNKIEYDFTVINNIFKLL